MQAFPAGIPAEESDPFLMCDYFGPSKSNGESKHEDEFPIGWHPHRGMDIATYLKQGIGRHADSLGNRGTFKTPGLQWISVGSGIEHAEGGGNPKGTLEEGFQLWFNVPSNRKMDDPRYGTEDPSSLPLLELGNGVAGRLIAGSLLGKSGPFKSVQPMIVVDIEMEAKSSAVVEIPIDLDNVIAYIYQGSGNVGGNAVSKDSVLRFNGSMILLTQAGEIRTIEFRSESSMKAMLFAGKMLKQPIAWHGPFVMTTNQEIMQTITEYRSGNFPPKRTAWDYKRIDEFPKK